MARDRGIVSLEPESEFPPEEAARRSEQVLKHMLNRPPQPHLSRQSRSENQKPADAGRGKKPSGRGESS